MKQFFTLLFLAVFTTTFFAGGINSNVKEMKMGNGQTAIEGINDVSFLEEGWESGTLIPWENADANSIPAMWHLDDWNGYNGTMSWRVADPALGTNGGYNNSWYQVLDTEEITLSGSGQTLTFYQRYSVEGPGGEPAGYDGWDGMNVRISTDGGSTWAVLTNPTPAYTATSLYAFGFEHGEGEGVPGWAGTLADWTMATFDISAYSGQTVMIRFAFASDPGYSTPQQADLFGWQVDDIVVANSSSTIWSNDGTESGVTPVNYATTGALLWRVTDNTTLGAAAEGTYFVTCNNESDTYEPNMSNTLTSEYFYIPNAATEAYMDFMVRGSWLDNDVFPDVDFFGAYVQVQGESEWRYVSNIIQDPDGDNFVYSDAPATWALFSETYSTGLIDISTLHGKTIRVIFEFESDEDDPIGMGLEIDNIMVWTPLNVPVEFTTFTAVQNGSKVNLNWNTATETNNQGFEVERKLVSSDENAQWKTVGFVEGKGTTTEPSDYTFTDNISGLSAQKVVYRLKQIDLNGSFEYSDEVEVSEFVPSEFVLDQNYPNPFNPSTMISVGIPADNFVSLKVYNLLGQQVATLHEGFLSAGNHEFNFDASSLTSGLYFYVMTSGANEGAADFTASRKMMLLK